MKYYFITGTSRGIGHALAELLAGEQESFVYGFGRTNTITHANYMHRYIDLSNIHAVRQLRFKHLEQPRRIVLINNAGLIGEMNYMGRLNDEIMITAFQVNLIAPALLMNNFMRAYRLVDCEKIIINISSGAARHAVDGWGEYCSTKAGLDMLSAVIRDEQERSGLKRPFKVFSVSPGIVETVMQEEIRKTAPENFSRVQEFRDLKDENRLISTARAAEKIRQLIRQPESGGSVQVQLEYDE